MINFIDEYGKQHAAVVECQKTKGVNGEKSLSGTIYTNDEILEGIGRGWRLQFEEENYCLTYVNPIDEGNRIVVEFDAVHEFFFDLKKSVIYSEMNGSNTANAYLQFIFNGSGYEYRLEVTIPAFEKESFGMKNRLDLFKDFISSTGVEFSVNGKIVRILEKVGTNLSTVVKKGFNLNELRIEKDPGSFITYLRGYGAFVDPDDESKGRLIVEYLSPLAEIYGKLEGDPIIDERYKVESNFVSRLKNDVESSYGISVDIDMEDLTKSGYEYDQPHEGDYIMAINKDLGIEQKIRIMSYTTSYDTEGNIIDHDVSCGSDNIVQKKINEENEYRKEVQAGLENAISTANQAWISADGKSKVFIGPDKPENGNKGDIWYQIDGEKTIMKYWDGYDWIPFIDPSALQADVENAINTAEGAKQDAADAYTNAVAETERQVQEQSNAFDEKMKQQKTELSSDINVAVTKANDAVTKATAAALKADNSEQLANQAKTDAANAVANVGTAVAKAEQAMIDAKDALSGIDGLKEDVEVEITRIDGELNAKVSQTVYDQLAGTVESQGTLISQNTSAINLKANQSTVDTLNGRVTSAEGSLNILGGQVSLKADKSEVDTLTGKVNANSAELNVQSDKIAGLVTKTDGQATKIGALELQAGQFNLTLSSVQSDLAGLEVGTRNYALMTSVPKIVPQNNYAKHLYDLSNGAFDIESNAEIMVTFDWEAPDATESSKFRLNRVVKFKNGAADQWSGMIVGNGGDVLTKAKKGSYAGIWKWYRTDYSSADISKIEVVLNQTVLGGAIKISNLAVRIGNKATDWTPAPEDMATVTALTSVQATVDGLVTTVATKANQSQVTQMADQITSVVQNTSDLVNKFPDSKFAKKVPEPTAEGSVTYNYDEDGLFVKNNGTTRSRIYWQIGFVVGQTYNIRLLANCEAEVSEIEIGTSEGENLKVNPSLNENWTEGTIKVTKWTALSIFIQPGKAIRLREFCVYNANTGLTTSKITQLSDQINLRVQKGEVINQINVSTEGILIQGKKIQLDGDVTITAAWINKLYADTAFISNLETKTINAVKANITSIITSSLAANTITSTHIKADNAMINKLFATTALIEQLTSKQAFINNIKAIEISADKITGGTINGATVNVINLNASSITTGIIRGANLSINLGTGEVLFTKGSIRNADGTFVMNIITGVVSSRGEVLSPNDTGEMLPTGFDLMNGRLDFLNGTFGETSVNYGGIMTDTHFGQASTGSNTWTLSGTFGNAPSLILHNGDSNASVWQSWKKNVAVGTKVFKELQNPTTSNLIRDGLGTAGVNNQNIIGGAIGLAMNSNSSISPAGYGQTTAVIQARNGIILSSGFGYTHRYGNTTSTRTSVAAIEIGSKENGLTTSDYVKQAAASIVMTGYLIQLKAYEFRVDSVDAKINGKLSAWQAAITGMTSKSGSANVIADTSGNLFRVSSARKYKTDIQVATDVINHAKKVLQINPSSWWDKAELANGTAKNRYYGFIADEFHALGLNEVVVYSQTGEVDSLAYDRLTMYHNVILTEHEKEIEQLKKRILELEKNIKVA